MSDPVQTTPTQTGDQPIATVVSQFPSFGPSDDGSNAQGYRVNFKTRDGDTGYVFIPTAQFNRDTVLARIKDAAQKLIDVHGASVY